MLNYFPRFFSVRAIICYLVTLALVSSFFMRFAMPFQFMLFGIVSVLIFFVYVNNLTQKWQYFKPKLFTKKLFITALLIRIVYVIFIYFYYIEMTGRPNMYHAGDELFYVEMSSYLRDNHGSFSEVNRLMHLYRIGFSDSGYCWWVAIIGWIFGPHILWPRIIKCVIDAFSCVLIYNLAKRNFGEAAGRITAVMCMLMPNMWYYCGITLKESEMAFMVILYLERADLAFRSREISVKNLLLPALIVLAMFTFRTALASVMLASLVVALVLSSGKQLQLWKKILYSIALALWMFLTIGVEITQEAQQLWEGRGENQTVGYDARLNRLENNTIRQYATASVFAPLIFTIPFSSMVSIPNQENQMMLNGGNFIKNILSGFTIFALVIMLIKGSWRQHVLPIAVTVGYLGVLIFSTFAHAERFHFPVLAIELMFAAYGITLLRNKHKRWIVMWLVFMCVAVVVWNWIKLMGRGWA